LPETSVLGSGGCDTRGSTAGEREAMTQQPTASRFEGHTLLAIGVGVAAAIAVGFVCYWLHVPPPVQGPLTGGAVGLPAAIDYYIQNRRRDHRDDVARIKRNELRRPVGLVVAMLAVVLLVIEQAGWFAGLTLAGEIKSMLVPFSLALTAYFFVASYTSHYLGSRPYFWTFVAVVCSYLLQLLILAPLPVLHETISARGGSKYAVHIILGLGYVISLGVCLLGVRYGRRHHEKFLAKKLARMERKAAQENPPEPPPPPTPGLDLLDQLKKLAELRDAGVLTDKEFEEKKAQILARL
jgi:hypothetical protein